MENAVIMAAGMSSRFAPISYERPKGTLKVRGEVLVERQLRQLQEAGITDVTIVVGYKKEYFFQLAERCGARLVVNREYASRNNNGSLWLVREQLGNTYVCSSDDYFTVNPFESHVYKAYYSAQVTFGPTEEWCLTTGAGGRITGATVGGADAWTMLGHVYFDRAFSTRFRQVLERVYHLPQTAPKLWEAIYLDHVKELDMVIRKYPDGVINEFDSLDELRAFDPHFLENLDSEVFDNISTALGCSPEDITALYPLKQGITNLSCHFAVGGQEYVYRHPGAGTDKMVDRQAEFEALHLASGLGVDSTFVTGDPVKGWKISRFVPEARNLDATNPQELEAAMRMCRQVHQSGRRLSRHFDFVAEGLRYESLLQGHGPIDVPGYSELRAKVLRLKELVDADGLPLVPSHNDFFPLNFLVDPSGRLDLIDWEYAGMSDEASDYGTMVVCAELSEELAEPALQEAYLGRPATPVEERHYRATSSSPAGAGTCGPCSRSARATTSASGCWSTTGTPPAAWTSCWPATSRSRARPVTRPGRSPWHEVRHPVRRHLGPGHRHPGLAVALAPFLGAAEAPLASALVHDLASALILLVYMGVRGRLSHSLAALRTRSGKVVALGALLGGPVGMSGYLVAINNIGPAYTAIISTFYPAVGTFLAFVVLKERLRPHQVVALLVALGAIITIGWSSSAESTHGNAWLGIAGALACVVGWGSEAVVLTWGMRDEAVDNETALHIRQTTSALPTWRWWPPDRDPGLQQAGGPEPGHRRHSAGRPGRLHLLPVLLQGPGHDRGLPGHGPEHLLLRLGGGLRLPATGQRASLLQVVGCVVLLVGTVLAATPNWRDLGLGSQLRQA